MRALLHERTRVEQDYTTSLTGLKFKIAHKRAGSEKCSIADVLSVARGFRVPVSHECDDLTSAHPGRVGADRHQPSDLAFIEREVRLGQTSGEQVEVVSGVQPGDVVVAAGSFFVKAERERLGLRPAASTANAAFLRVAGVRVYHQARRPITR